eukprot:c10773_g1_i1.p1 GENE.c10773_g1_i1~~c10773_g1_i1.p1  ORF type:complete len:861 (-),score=248.09 c10773_g1_i1:59-2641(-)
MTRELLPSNPRPVHYAVTLTPDLAAFTYTGQVDVQVEVSEATTTITLNSKEIVVNQQTSSVVLADKTKLACTNVEYDTERERVTLTFEQSISPQTATLSIDFTGVLNDKLAGFYRSSYKVGEETRYMATTQFEAVEARRALPCWDEPALKATFDVTLVVPEDRVALSNMDIVSSEAIGGGLKRVVFNRTPKMSTYLLAFTVGELESIESHTNSGVVVRVWTPPGFKEEGEFSLSVATQTLDFFTTYFDIPYPLPKMDMVAVPDFAAGAMENWGLVLYRTTVLLYNPKSTPLNMKQRIAYVVCHELAHQWFGNLVTMEWWVDLWLNEAFATWVGWRAVDEIFPEWKVWDQFVVGEFGRGMELDSLKSSHPIEVEVNKAQEIDEIFDAISYSKGASVLRMLVATLGEEAFRNGTRQYLKKHIYSNTRTVDLWEALSEASNTDVAALMNTWTLQTGYPVVKASKTQENVLELTQSRFLSTGAAPEDQALWNVPVRAVYGSDSVAPSFSTPHLFATKTTNFALPEVASSPNGWFKLNVEQAGFFRVQYNADLLTAVSRSLPHISAADRTGLVSDAFALASSGFSSAIDALTLLKGFTNERDYIVWNETVNGLRNLSSTWADEDQLVQNALTKFSLNLVTPLVKELGWEPKTGEAHSLSMLRPLLVSFAAQLGHPETVEEAKSRFARFVAGDQQALHADLLKVAFAAVQKHGDSSVFDTLLALFRKFTSAEQKVSVLQSLGYGSNENVLRACQFSLTDEVRTQDMVYVYGACGSNPTGRAATWKFVKDNWKAISEKIQGGMLMTRVVQYSTDSLSTHEFAKDVQSFFEANPAPSLARTINQAVEGIEARAAWVERDRAALAAYFN